MATEFARWVGGLDAKRAAKGDAGGGPASASARSGFSREGSEAGDELAAAGCADGEEERSAEEKLKDLEQEMKLLRWHKLANEAALKAALIKTKRIKAKETRAVEKGGIRQREQAAWMQQVIQEEQGKPLEVSETFIKEFQDREAQDDARVERDMKQHLSNLRRVKEEAEKRDEVRRRNAVYKEKKKLLERRARAIQDASLRRGLAARATGADSLLDADSLRDEVRAISAELSNAEDDGAGAGAGAGAAGASPGLGKVVTALDRLVELEKRIAQLEKEYDSSATKRFQFARSHSEATEVTPAKTKYFVRVKQPAGKPRLPATAALALRNQEEEGGGDQHQPDEEGEPGGAFLTALPPVRGGAGAARGRAAARGQARDRGAGSNSRGASNNSRASAAAAARASRVKSRLSGAQQQDQVVASWLQARQQARKAPPKRGLGGAARSSSSSSKSTAIVVRDAAERKLPTAKDRMKEFREVRKQFDRKKQALSRPLHAVSDGLASRKVPARAPNARAAPAPGARKAPLRIADKPAHSAARRSRGSATSSSSSATKQMPHLAPVTRHL